MGCRHHALAALPPGKNPYPLYRRLGRPQGRSGRVRKISPPSGFDPWTVSSSVKAHLSRPQNQHSNYTMNCVKRHRICCIYTFFADQLFPATAVTGNTWIQYGVTLFFVGWCACLLLDILQIPPGCIEICSGCFEPSCNQPTNQPPPGCRFAHNLSISRSLLRDKAKSS